MKTPTKTYDLNKTLKQMAEERSRHSRLVPQE